MRHLERGGILLSENNSITILNGLHCGASEDKRFLMMLPCYSPWHENKERLRRNLGVNFSKFLFLSTSRIFVV